MPALHGSLTRLVRGSLAALALAPALGCGATQSQADSAGAPLKVVWPIDNISQVGAYKLGVYGAPVVTNTPLGPALCFGGKEDGIVFPVNALDAQYDFTIEVLFKPDPDGSPKQQFFHVEDKAEGRVMLELRLSQNGKFYVHSFIRSGAEQQELENEVAQHPASEWTWAAITYTSGTVKHYVNGEQEASAMLDFGRMKKGEMAVGARLSRENWFKGCVREIRFANAALPPEELASKPAK